MNNKAFDRIGTIVYAVMPDGKEAYVGQATACRGPHEALACRPSQTGICSCSDSEEFTAMGDHLATVAEGFIRGAFPGRKPMLAGKPVGSGGLFGCSHAIDGEGEVLASFKVVEHDISTEEGQAAMDKALEENENPMRPNPFDVAHAIDATRFQADWSDN